MDMDLMDSVIDEGGGSSVSREVRGQTILIIQQPCTCCRYVVSVCQCQCQCHHILMFYSVVIMTRKLGGS